MAQLMPTTYVSDVTQDWAILLWAILNNKSIDVGWLLTHQMVHESHIKGIGNVYFPTIVRMLCTIAAVKWDKHDVAVNPAIIINKQTFKNYKLPTD